VTLLVESRQKDSEFSSVDREDVVTMLVDFILAGTDTTSNLCSFIVAELINHPEHQKRVADEVDHVYSSSQPSTDKIDRIHSNQCSSDYLLHVSP
jgi:cytochrome P450